MKQEKTTMNEGFGTGETEEVILLALLPFWDPQIPPLGISVLKTFLQIHNYKVKVVDLNVCAEFREIYRNYFDVLAEYVPRNHRRHLYNIGHEVLKNHMMLHLNSTPERRYIDLVKVLVNKTFYFAPEEHQILELKEIIHRFYSKLRNHLLDLFQQTNPTVLGLSVYSGTLPASMFAFELAKETMPHIKTIMGGGIFFSDLAFGSPNFDFFLERAENIDKIIIGEGENLLLQFLKGELAPSQKVYKSRDIDEGAIELATASLPDFSDFDLEQYPHLSSYTSRSCTFQCNFCVETSYWGKFRQKRSKQIANELVQLYEKYQSQLFVLCDCLLNPIIKDLSHELINGSVSLFWDGYIRADPPTANIENTLLWRRGGFYRARLGVESGSQRILDLMNKKLTVNHIKSSVNSLAYAGIKTSTLWVIGYPGETEEDFQKTLALVEELKDNIYEADCNPFWFFLTGQGNSSKWSKKNRPTPLYPEEAKDMLILQTWILDGQPSREETYRRVNRFIEHCEKLGVPNPYTLYDIEMADRRWQKLQKNAVPPLMEFIKKDAYISENRNVKKLHFARKIEDTGDWGF